jgi:hypothetical protein
MMQNDKQEAEKLSTIVKTALAKYWQPRLQQITDTTLQLIGQFVRALAFLKRKRPLIHHIASLATMNEVANVTKFIGAVPFLAHAPNEVPSNSLSFFIVFPNFSTNSKDIVSLYNA